jgi:hypothetical protein
VSPEEDLLPAPCDSELMDGSGMAFTIVFGVTPKAVGNAVLRPRVVTEFRLQNS